MQLMGREKGKVRGIRPDLANLCPAVDGRPVHQSKAVLIASSACTDRFDEQLGPCVAIDKRSGDSARAVSTLEVDSASTAAHCRTDLGPKTRSGKGAPDGKATDASPHAGQHPILHVTNTKQTARMGTREARKFIRVIRESNHPRDDSSDDRTREVHRFEYE